MIDRKNSQPSICLVFPCHNEEEVLPDLIKVLRSLDLGIPMRILFIDDGSEDNTLSILKQACDSDHRMACISLSRNFGHQIAVGAGLRHAIGDLIAVLDADLQDPPELLSQFISQWREGFDVVYGIRTNRKESWFLRYPYENPISSAPKP